MISNEERRNIAERLRDMDESASVMDMILTIEPDVRKPYTWRDLAERIAYLVEPFGYECVPGECPINVRHDSDRIDRDALIVLARNLDLLALMVNSHELTNTGQIAGACHNIANGIREALWVSNDSNE